MKKRSATHRTVASPLAAPAPPQREYYRPAWYHRRLPSIQHTSHTLPWWVEQIEEGVLRLPRFQRPYVWREDQVRRLWDSLLRGFHVGSLLLWEQYGLPPSVERFADVEVASHVTHYGHALVVDGQQRLGAIATLALTTRYHIDVDAGTLHTEPGPWRIPAAVVLKHGHTSSLIDWTKEHPLEHGLDPERVWDAAVALADVASNTMLSAVRLERGWPIEVVIESYKRLNTEGTPMDPNDLAEGLRRATESPQT